MNLIILKGFLTKEPEQRTTQSGISRTTFTLAVSRKTKNDEGKYDVDFIDCVSWRTTADIIYKHFHKGEPILVEGSIRKDTFKDKEGSTKYTTYVLVDSFDFIGAPKEVKKDTIGNENIFADEIPLTDEDLPF